MSDPWPTGAEADQLYQMLVEAHRDLSPESSRRLDARLVLLLAERIGDLEVIREALAAARAAEPDAR